MESNSKLETYKFNISPNADEIESLLEKILKETKKGEKTSSEIDFKLELSLREMLANAIEHGCKLKTNNNLRKDLEIKIMLKIYPDRIILQVQDPGSGFNWKDHDLKMSLSFKEKGRGLKMINKVADKIEFNQKGNIITVTFYI